MRTIFGSEGSKSVSSRPLTGASYRCKDLVDDVLTGAHTEEEHIRNQNELIQLITW